MASPQQTFSIAIIGSGIGGLALAIGLLRQNVKCTIFEAAPRFDAVGAGIGLGPNALRAMELMDDEFARLYDAIKVGNISPERVHEQIEILAAEEGFGTETGWHGGSVGHPKFERSSAHRKTLLELMKSLIPDGTVVFNKRVTEINQSAVTSKVALIFSDGESASFDAVIGCDGIKGMTRRVVLGSRFPEEVLAKYCNTYIYRGIAPMEEAKAILGSYALDARWYMSEGKGWAMYPISKGQELNLVAFVYDQSEWQGERSPREVSREAMIAEFEGFDGRLQKLLEVSPMRYQETSDDLLTEEQYVKPMRWPLFHHPDTPTYVENRVCLLGDCAHASSPSQAAGAGQGLEDALILSRLLGLVRNPAQVGIAFQIYDSIRRPRAQSVVQESHEVGMVYFLIDPNFGHDLQRITDEANRRLPLLWWYDLEADVKEAEARFKALTAGVGKEYTKNESVLKVCSVEIS